MSEYMHMNVVGKGRRERETERADERRGEGKGKGSGVECDAKNDSRYAWTRQKCHG